MKICCIIPARLNSSRFPNKLIQDLDGIKVLDWVINMAKSCNFDKIILATDSEYLQTLYNNHIEVLLMSENVWCGSQRAFYVWKKYPKYDYYITLPSDEPLINSSELKKSLNNYFSNKTDLIATMGSDWLPNEKKRFESNKSCKIIFNKNDILYFSRAQVPLAKEDEEIMNYSKKHLGIFIFSKKFFKKYKNKAWQNYESSLAKIEGLEQTIFIENNFNIKLINIKHKYYGIDMPEDLINLQKLIND